MPSEKNLRKRSFWSFGIFGLCAILLVVSWKIINHVDEDSDDDPPKPLRAVLELNGRLWQSLFRPSRTSTCTPPKTGKIPRSNGDIGLTKIDPEQWHMEIVADDQDPQSRAIVVNLQDMKKLPRTEMGTEFKCIEGWSEDMGFAGVKFSDFMAAYNLKPKRYVGLESVDGEYYVSIDMDSMLHEQTLLAYEMNGMPLLPANGSPLRLVIPVKYGIKNIKQIGKIFFSDKRPPDYWEERGYDWYAGL